MCRLWNGSKSTNPTFQFKANLLVLVLCHRRVFTCPPLWVPLKWHLNGPKKGSHDLKSTLSFSKTFSVSATHWVTNANSNIQVQVCCIYSPKSLTLFALGGFTSCTVVTSSALRPSDWASKNCKPFRDREELYGKNTECKTGLGLFVTVHCPLCKHALRKDSFPYYKDRATKSAAY